MKIYIDSTYKCHTVNGGTMREVDTSFFDGKCAAFVEGYRYVPQGETWTRSDGVKFYGEMIAPWQSYSQLAAAQRAYEDGIDSMDGTIATLMDEIEALCGELIGG